MEDKRVLEREIMNNKQLSSEEKKTKEQEIKVKEENLKKLLDEELGGVKPRKRYDALSHIADRNPIKPTM